MASVDYVPCNDRIAPTRSAPAGAVRSRATRDGVSHPLARCRINANPIRTCGTVNAGTAFFPPTRLHHEEPRRDQRQRHVVVPAPPVPHLVLTQARLALGALQALLDPVRRLRHPGEFRQRRRAGRWRGGNPA